VKRSAAPPQIIEIEARAFDDLVADLAELLFDAVDSGASVGFVRPFTRDDAAAWWRGIAPELARGVTLVLAASVEGRVVGTAQLRLAQLPNSRHRAEVAKVLVHRDARRRGIGRVLMSAIEDLARRHRRTLLFLDTITGSDAVRLYEGLGWTRAGEIPRYAGMPDGTLAPTTIFFKELR
jgi:GNAT superfamily N-acetyltransferase